MLAILFKCGQLGRFNLGGRIVFAVVLRHSVEMLPVVVLFFLLAFLFVHDWTHISDCKVVLGFR